MIIEMIFKVFEKMPRLNPGRDEFTRKAFEMLPRIENPKILDIGCGSGTPTLEVARISGGDITALDICQPWLDELSAKAEKAGLAERIKTVQCSMTEMDFPDNSFDIIWSEGSIFIVGFENGLKDWRRLLRPRGFLVVEEVVWLKPDPPEEIVDFWEELYPGLTTVEKNIENASASGYEPLGSFPLPEDAWRDEFYGPLQKRVDEMRTTHASDEKMISFLDVMQREIDMYAKYGDYYGAAFFVMRKTD